MHTNRISTLLMVGHANIRSLKYGNQYAVYRICALSKAIATDRYRLILLRFFIIKQFCIEKWREASPVSKLIYSVASSLFQFLIPATIVVFAHASICARLRRRSRPVGSKTHNLLSATALTFAICWTSLNLFDLLDDYFPFLSNCREVKLAVCRLA